MAFSVSDCICSHQLSTMARSDSDIWADVMSGHAAAWAELVKKYEALVYTVPLRAGLSQMEMADCFQQTWVQLYTHRERIQDPSRLSAWLVTTAKREALRVRRRARMEQTDFDFTTEADDEDRHPDRLLEQLELQTNLQVAIGQIDERCQKLLRLLFFSPQDTSYEAVARALNISSNALGPARRRCLERLKKVLLENGYLDARNETEPALSGRKTKRSKKNMD